MLLSVRTTETYCAHFLPHYAAYRALEVLEEKSSPQSKVDENWTTATGN
jgi:hypothetical protein